MKKAADADHYPVGTGPVNMSAANPVKRCQQ